MSTQALPTETTPEAGDLRVQVRLSPEIATRVDAELERMREREPGATLTRSDAIRSLLLRGLEVPR